MALKEKYKMLFSDPFEEIRKKQTAYSTIAIVASVLITMLPCLFNGFTNWDDDLILLENTHIRGLGISYLARMFSSFHLGHYNPIVMLSYAIQYKLFGYHPFPYHLGNLILHVINSLLVFFMIYRLTGRIFIGLVTSLLFGIHPLHVESVAWVTERKDVLYTMFFLFSIIAYLDYKEKKEIKTYLYCLGFFFLSLLSKGMAITLPLVLILIDYLEGTRISRKNLTVKLPFFILSAIFAGIALLGTYSSGATKSEHVQKFYDNFFIASAGVVSYLIKFILPFNLSALYPFPVKEGSLLPVKFLISPIIAGAIVYGIIKSRVYTKKIVFGFTFFFVVILPVLQLIPSGPAYMADRYTYVSSIGIFYIAAELIHYLAYTFFKGIENFKRIIIALFIILLCFYGIITYNRCRVWKNPITLWNDVLSKYPDSALAYNNRGSAFLIEKDYIPAEKDFLRALEIKPSHFKAAYNLGKLFSAQGEIPEAIKYYKKALSIKPDYTEALNNLGVLYAQTGENDKAVASFIKAIEYDPKNAEAYNNRGLYYINSGQYDAALADTSKALSIRINYPEAYYNRGLAWFYKKNYRNALINFSSAVENNPDYIKAYYNRALCLSALGRKNEALADLNIVIEAEPLNSEALKNRGSINDDLGNFGDALKDLTKSIQVNSEDDAAYLARGIVYMNRKNYDNAIDDFRNAIAINHLSSTAYNNLAVAYYVKKDYEKAWQTISEMEDAGLEVNIQLINNLRRQSEEE